MAPSTKVMKPSKIIKVFHVISSLRYGGKERQLIELLKGLRSCKNIHCAVALVTKNIRYQEIRNLGFKIYILKKHIHSFGPPLYSLFRICKNEQPDIIQAWGFREVRIAAIPAKLLNIKIIHFGIQYGHSIRKFSRLWLYGKITFPLADLIIANSRAGLMSHNLQESSRVLCIYNGFDLNRIPKNISIKKGNELNIKSNKVIAMTASFSGGKDHKTLIHAGMRLLQSRKDISFIFIGDGATRKDMEILVEGRYKSYFHFLGWRDKVEDILQQIDIGVLLAAAGHGEGISNAIMEYMASAKPVIATDIGGNRELLVDNETGFLIPHEDVTALTDKLNLLLDNHELRAEMGLRGYARIKKFFNLDIMISHFVNIYEQLGSQ